MLPSGFLANSNLLRVSRQTCQSDEKPDNKVKPEVYKDIFVFTTELRKIPENCSYKSCAIGYHVKRGESLHLRHTAFMVFLSRQVQFVQNSRFHPIIPLLILQMLLS